MNTKGIPIVVPVYGAVEYTKRFVNSILRNTSKGTYCVYFVDNASPDNTAEYLSQLVKEQPESFRVITSPVNKGFAGGVNIGLSSVSQLEWTHVVVMNNDVIVTPGWLDSLYACINGSSLPDTGVVAPVSNEAGGSQRVPIDYSNPTDESIDGYGLRRKYTHQGVWIESGLIVGLCWMMTRKFFEQVGYLDESFGIGQWEDNDYFLRGQLLGYHYVVDHSTFIHHFWHKSFSENQVESNSLYHKNREVYCEKYTKVDGVYDQLASANYQKRGQELQRDSTGHVRKYIVGALRVRDGEKYLKRTLDRVSQFVDEIVIRVDKRTTDSTIEICKRYPKVVELQVEEDVYDEWVARDKLIELAYIRNPDWVWCFDADEVPDKGILRDRDYLTNPPRPDTHLWIFTLIQLWTEGDENTPPKWRIDGLWGTFAQGRMFRAIPGKHIAQGVLHCGSHPQFAAESVRRCYHKIIHYGNCDAKIRQDKYTFYTRTDTDKDIHRIFGHWKSYYWELYYGRVPENIDPRQATWKAVADDTPDPLPYGSFRIKDLYLHVKDDSKGKFIDYSEDRTITLCMLAKNESSYLAKCIGSVSPIVDEVIVVDTGSTDTTIDAAEWLGAKVYKFEWCDDFSKARNFSMSKVTSNWLLRLDPDECVPYQFIFGIYKLTEHQDTDAYLFPIHNYLQPPKDVNDTGWVLSETTRLFKMQPGIEFRGLVHEEIDDSIRELGQRRAGSPDKDPREFIRVERVPYFVQHFGYLRDTDFLDKKWGYYCDLGEKQIQEDPKDPRPWFNCAVHYFHKGDFAKALEGYKKVLELDPDDWKAWNDCGCIYWKSGNLVKALEFMKKARSALTATVHPVHSQKVEANLQLLKVSLYDGVAI